VIVATFQYIKRNALFAGCVGGNMVQMQNQNRIFCQKRGGPAASAIHHYVKTMRGTVLLSFMSSECGWLQRCEILVWGVLKTGDVGWQKENTIGIQLLER
jgi:hypothetical protein